MKTFSRLMAAFSLLLLSLYGANASAIDLTDITAAITSGEAATAAVSAGVISIAAVMMGLGLVVSWLRK